jgi:cobalt/nickel transport system permease protein
MTLTLDFPQCGRSILGQRDPRWKLAALVPAAVVVALLCSPGPALTALVGTWILLLLVRLPLRWYSSRLASTTLFLGLFVAFLPFLPDPENDYVAVGPLWLSMRGLTQAAVLLLRGLALATLTMVLLASAPLQDILKAAHALRVPGLVVQLALLAYRYVYLLAEELGRLRIALRVRGFRNRADMHSYRTIGQVAGTLLVRGQERAERIGQAMRCRGFDGVFRSLHEFSTTWRDVLTWSIIAACSVGLLVWDFLWR